MKGITSQPGAARRAGIWLFASVLLVYSVCPPFTSYDSYYVVPTALSILQHGSTAVDTYVSGAPPASRYAVECVPPAGRAVPFDDAPGGCAGGHWYNSFSIGVPVLATPLVLAIRAGTGIEAALFPHLAAAVRQPVIAAFLSGDLVGGHAIVELLCAAFFGALAVLTQYAIARRFFPPGGAVALALLFAFGTSEWSIGSRNLMQHGLTILLLSLAVYLALLAREEPRRIALVAVPAAIAFTVRPSNFIGVLAFTVYVAIHYRAQLPRYLACASPVAAAFFAYNLLVRHSLFPRYYDAGFPDQVQPFLGFAMHWVSPSRGVLTFTPVFVFALAGIYVAFRRGWLFPLTPYLAAILVAHSLLIARYFGGHSYGPRYFSDVTGLFVFFLIPAIAHWRAMPPGALRRALAAVFLLLACWGVFAHGRGATSIAAIEWSALPVSVDDAKWRVWDWRDPQFLRGL